jgi:acyl-CoA reductase-like NAD-dependent aldehyde dehydrogenase
MCGGERIGKKGFYFAPTAFEVTDKNAKIAQEEIFGPVQCIFKWNDMEQVSTWCQSLQRRKGEVCRFLGA